MVRVRPPFMRVSFGIQGRGSRVVAAAATRVLEYGGHARTGRFVNRFIRFGAVGTLGFLVDAATVTATAPLLGLYVAGLAAYLVAATANWFVNRIWTFRGPHRLSMVRQWAMFLAANSLGFVLNRGTYVVLIATVALCHAHPVVAIMAGSVAGLFANFFLSQRVVFR